MREYVKHFESKNNRLEIVGSNQKILLNEIYDILDHFDISQESKLFITTPSSFQYLSGPGLEKVIQLTVDFEEIYRFYLTLSPEVKTATFVKEKMSDYTKYLNELQTGVLTFLQEDFSKLASTEKNSKTKDVLWSNLGHHSLYEALAPFESLFHWLKRMFELQNQPSRFSMLSDV